MITYNEIYEAAKKERYSEQLQALPKNFIASVAEYLKEKKEMSSKEDDAFSDMITKTKKQFETAVVLFNELKRIRRKKILNLVLMLLRREYRREILRICSILRKNFLKNL